MIGHNTRIQQYEIMDNMSDEEYENLHPHDYEGQEQERKELLDKHGPILAISHAVHYMKLRLDHNGKENPHRAWGTVTHYLEKYVDEIDKHDYSANLSYVVNKGGGGSHAETRDHLEIIKRNVNHIHQVVKYNLGNDHPITQGMAKDAEKINHHINMFQWSSQMEED